MNTPDPSADEARLSALFQSLVAQQANMAAICLGQAPDESGQQSQDLPGARFFIDQLEMLDAKTKGNLTKDEGALLKQTLTALRLAFVEAANASGSSPKPAPAPAASPQSPVITPPPQQSDDAESRKKFTKKY